MAQPIGIQPETSVEIIPVQVREFRPGDYSGTPTADQIDHTSTPADFKGAVTNFAQDGNPDIRKGRGIRDALIAGAALGGLMLVLGVAGHSDMKDAQKSAHPPVPTLSDK